MGSDRQNNTGCLFPLGDDFLPILMFFYQLNEPRGGGFETEADVRDDEEQDDEAEDDQG